MSTAVVEMTSTGGIPRQIHHFLLHAHPRPHRYILPRSQPRPHQMAAGVEEGGARSLSKSGKTTTGGTLK